MKKSVLILAVLGLFLLAGSSLASAANQDTTQNSKKELIRKDSLSIDDLDPVFYEPDLEDQEADSNGAIPLAAYLIIAVVVVGGGIYFFLRSKKK